jgi:hypothetical protein
MCIYDKYINTVKNFCHYSYIKYLEVMESIVLLSLNSIKSHYELTPYAC